MTNRDPQEIEKERASFRLDDIPDEDPDLRGDRSYIDRILDAYADMRWSTRSIIQSAPSEGRLLFFALLSDVIFFVARSLSMVIAPPDGLVEALPAQFALGLFVAFLLRTSLFYVIAVIAVIVSRPFGGKGSWYDTRCAVFWAALVSAPVELFAAFVTVGVVQLGGQSGPLAFLVEAPFFIGPIAFGFFLAAGIAEAQGFRYTYRVMAVTAVLFIGAVWAFLSLGA